MAISRSLSIEDGNLNIPSLVTTRKVDYSDIDLTFTATATGDVYKKLDAAAVKQSVKNILLTDFAEKPFKPMFGSGLKALLFDLIDDDLEDQIESVIKNSITNFEPRAKVINVITIAAPDNNSVNISVVFQIITTNETVTLNTNLKRLR